MVICLGRGADLHMTQLMPLPLTVSCFNKIQIGFAFLVPAHLGGPGRGPLNGCVCVYVCVYTKILTTFHILYNLPINLQCMCHSFLTVRCIFLPGLVKSRWAGITVDLTANNKSFGGFLPPFLHCVVRTFGYPPKQGYLSLKLCVPNWSYKISSCQLHQWWSLLTTLTN